MQKAFSTNRKALFSFMGILVLFLLISNLLAVYQQRTMWLDYAKQHVDHESLLISKLVSEALLKGDYSTVEYFLAQWAKERPHIDKVHVTAVNGFVLAQYERDSEQSSPYEVKQDIAYIDGKTLTLQIVADLTHIHDNIQYLALQLFSASIILVAIMGVLLWRSLLKNAITPLQEEITEKKRVQQQLSEYSMQLAQARDMAIAATQAKSEFLANMSHELRTPLNSIIGFTSLIKEEQVGPVNEEQKKQLSIVYNCSHHLLQLINSILDLAKVEAGKIEIVKSHFDVIALLQDCIGIMQALARQKDLTIKLNPQQDAANFYTDKQKLRQVILNLLSNAIKFTTQGNIVISCRQTKDELTIEIQDTGIGIAESQQHSIFYAFQQVDGSDTREQQGTGLGLAICAHYIDRLGGTLTVQSTLGKGSTFQIRLPDIENTVINTQKKSSRKSALTEA